MLLVMLAYLELKRGRLKRWPDFASPEATKHPHSGVSSQISPNHYSIPLIFLTYSILSAALYSSLSA